MNRAESFLLGNARTKGEKRRKEKDNVFGIGSRSPIAITFLVKNPRSSKKGEIYFYDIGDYLTRRQKLDKVQSFSGIDGISKAGAWHGIVPNEYGDWLLQRDVSFQKYMALGGKSGGDEARFFGSNYGPGLVSSRDFWVYNDSKTDLSKNMKITIGFYNYSIDNASIPEQALNDSSKISWSRGLRQSRKKKKRAAFNPGQVRIAAYRPFNRRYFYHDRLFNEVLGKISKAFPKPDSQNRVIAITGGSGVDFSVLMEKYLPDFSFMGGGQCYPLRMYRVGMPSKSSQKDLLASNKGEESEAIDASSLLRFRSYGEGVAMQSEDAFYYVYGALHSEEFRKRFKANLEMEMTRIPPPKKPEDFLKFVDAGRRLADLHCNFEEVAIYPVKFERGDAGLIAPVDSASFYRVAKMKFEGKRSNPDKSTVIYNSNITISGIPLEAYEYVVNGKSALEWVMERQQVITDKDSGIVNDPNAFAIEACNNPAYPLELFQRVITVSLETMKIVKSLPPLDLKD